MLDRILPGFDDEPPLIAVGRRALDDPLKIEAAVAGDGEGSSKATAFATSRGARRRPNGCSAAAFSSQFGSAPWYSRWILSSLSEAIQPMLSWLTRISFRMAAKAVFSVKVASAA